MNARRVALLLLLVVSAAPLSGCGNESSSQKAGAGSPKPPATPPAASQPAVVAPQFAAAPAPAASSPPRAVPSTTPIDPGPAPGMERVVARPGITGKGGYEEGVLAPITAPLNAYWSAREMAVFEIGIVRAMQLFEVDKQRKPSSHDEFMREIIAKNNFKLPDLQAGHRYVYDPKQGRLMVELPVGSAPPTK